jgi:hypothetical protein
MNIKQGGTMNNQMLFSYKGVDWKVGSHGEAVILQYKVRDKTTASFFVNLEGVMSFIDDNFEILNNGFSSPNTGKWLGE